MSYCEFSGVKIAGIACAVPTQIIDNSKASAISQKEIARFIKNMGVKYRRCAVKKQTSSDLGFEAAKRLLNAKKIDPKSIDALIFLTQNPDYKQPSTAFVLAHRLGLGKDCMAFDANIGCAAFNYGVHMASSFIAGAKMKKVLVISGDASQQGHSNEQNQMLFSPCGAAVLLENSDPTGCEVKNSAIKSLVKQDGSGYAMMIVPGGGARHPIDPSKDINKQLEPIMIGADVMAFGVTEIPQTINEFLNITNSKVDDYDKIILHQANLMMIKAIAEKIGVSMDKVPICLDRFGNTNGSSVPLALVDMNMKENPKQLKILACSFGIGLSWGVNSFEINSNDILPLIETDEYYKEAY